MIKTIDGKKCIQIKDLMFIREKLSITIPRTIWDKVFVYGILITESDCDKFIELDTKEELEFYNQISEYIFDEDILSKLSHNELDNKINECKTKLDKNTREWFSCRNMKSFDIKENDRQGAILRYELDCLTSRNN